MSRQPPANVIEAAQAAQRATGILASVSLAQWALESGWGQRCTGKWNYFGVKAGRGQTGTMCWTHEVVGGRSVPVQAVFRDYDSLEDAFLQHAELLTHPQYAAGQQVKANLIAFVQAIGPVYATDPNYSAKILDLITTQGFERYDVLPPAAQEIA